MDGNPNLTPAFLAAVPDAVRDAWAVLDNDRALTARLAGAYDDARVAWPMLTLPHDAFARALAEHVGGCPPTEGTLAELRGPELYLVAGCRAGDARALRLLEDTYFPAVFAAVRRLRLAHAETEDIVQQFRTRLLVEGADGPPKIVEYAGKGDLGAWMRVVCVRQALKGLRKQNRRREIEDHLALEEAQPLSDPELERIKSAYLPEVKSAFHSALHGLEPRSRSLLLCHYVEAMTLEALATLYGAHRATVARWLQQARADLNRGVRASLTASLGITSGEFESVMRLVESRFDVTLSQALNAERERRGGPAGPRPTPEKA